MRRLVLAAILLGVLAPGALALTAEPKALAGELSWVRLTAAPGSFNVTSTASAEGFTVVHTRFVDTARLDVYILGRTPGRYPIRVTTYHPNPGPEELFGDVIVVDPGLGGVRVLLESPASGVVGLSPADVVLRIIPGTAELLNVFNFTTGQSVPFTAEAELGSTLIRASVALAPGLNTLIAAVRHPFFAEVVLAFEIPLFFEVTQPVTFDELLTFNTGVHYDLEVPIEEAPISEYKTLDFGGGSSVGRGGGGKESCDPTGPWWRWKTLNPQAGDPVLLRHGETYFEVCLLAVAGRKCDIRLCMSYRSRYSYNSREGRNWQGSWDMRLAKDPANSTNLIFYNGQARGDLFVFDPPSGTYRSPMGFFDRLVRLEDGSFELLHEKGRLFRFHGFTGSARDGKIIEAITPHGNRVTYEYDLAAGGRISRLADELGRSYAFHYRATDGRLEAVSDFSGRRAALEHDADGFLVSATSPATAAQPTGRTYRFGYTRAPGSLAHGNLESVTYPNQAATGGAARIVNTYGPDDRLVRQKVGGTTNGFEAGGEITYEYPAPDRTRTTDRRGNVCEYAFSPSGHCVRQEVFTRGLRAGDPASFVTLYDYTADGVLRSARHPEGNEVVRTVDTGNPDRAAQRNVTRVERLPGARGGAQGSIVTRTTYEPLFQGVASVTDPRGLDPTYSPQNGGERTPERYTTRYTWHWQKGDPETIALYGGLYTPRSLALRFGKDLAAVLAGGKKGDVDGGGLMPAGCNELVRIDYPTVRLPDGSEQQIVWQRQINRFGQTAKTIDGEGLVTTYAYFSASDPDGDGVPVESPRDTDDTGGYQRETVQDAELHERRTRRAGLVRIRNTYTYNSVGDQTSVTDGRGVKSVVVYNELHQVLEVRRAADVSASTERHLVALGYRVRHHHDFNGQLVLQETEVRDDNNPALPAFLATRWKRDILDLVREREEEITTGVFRRTVYEYDPNENPVEAVSSEAVRGAQPGNRTRTEYDERDLRLRVIRAPGTADESAVTFFYDKNRNLVAVEDAVDNNGDGRPERTTSRLDGFDRVVAQTNAVGSVTRNTYDAASNVVRTEREGTAGGPSPRNDRGAGNVLLAATEQKYDELSRAFQTDRVLFMPAGTILVHPAEPREGGPGGSLTPGDGRISAVSFHDRNSQVVRFLSDDEEATETEWDGVGRAARVVDPEGNEVSYRYDAANNLVEVAETDVSPEGTVAPETFKTLFVFDALGRRVRVTLNNGQTSYFFYNSRDQLILSRDAVGPLIADPLGLFPGTINGPGNSAHRIHDGLGRQVVLRRDLRVGGQGGAPLDTSNPANPDGTITETTEYDHNDRVTARADDKGNTTRYSYDNLDRLKVETLADGTRVRHFYDADSNRVKTIDPNGSVLDCTYDGANRRVRCDITRAAGVVGTTVQTWEWDGLDRMTRATDNNEPGIPDDDSTVLRKYDSVSRLVEELQNDRAVSTLWEADSDPAVLFYPDGKRLEYTLDKLDRPKSLRFGGKDLASYAYIGQSRLLSRTLANGVTTSVHEAGASTYDGIRRMTKLVHRDRRGHLVAGFEQGYDRANNPLFEKRLHFGGKGAQWRYDSVYRLVEHRDGVPDPSAPDVGEGTIKSESWGLDGVGNWATYTQDGTSATNAVNEVNEYREFAGKAQSHDDNGNRLEDDRFRYAWDAHNRLRTVREEGSGQLVATYVYDAMARRTRKSARGPGRSGDETTVFFWHGFGMIEERTGYGELVAQTAWRRSSEQIVSRTDYTRGGPEGEAILISEDCKGWVAVVTGAAGQFREGYGYTPYGQVRFTDKEGAPRERQTVSNPWLYHGYFRDGETGHYHTLHRYHDPRTGRWLGRDPLGFHDGMGLYEFVLGNPVVGADPSGLSNGNWEFTEEEARSSRQTTIKGVHVRINEIRHRESHVSRRRSGPWKGTVESWAFSSPSWDFTINCVAAGRGCNCRVDLTGLTVNVHFPNRAKYEAARSAYGTISYDDMVKHEFMHIWHATYEVIKARSYFLSHVLICSGGKCCDCDILAKELLPKVRNTLNSVYEAAMNELENATANGSRPIANEEALMRDMSRVMYERFREAAKYGYTSLECGVCEFRRLEQGR